MKLRAGLLTAALLLLGTNAMAAAPDSTPFYWQVPGADERTLQDAGFDVEHGVDGGVQVVGDARVAGRLTALGYQPKKFDTVYKPVPPGRSGDIGVQTFYGGYHTVAEHEKHLTDVAAAYPALTQVFDIGDSWRKTRGLGGHDIKAICITKSRPATAR